MMGVAGNRQRRQGWVMATAQPRDRRQPEEPRVRILQKTAVIGKIQMEYFVITGIGSRSADSDRRAYSYEDGRGRRRTRARRPVLMAGELMHTSGEEARLEAR